MSSDDLQEIKLGELCWVKGGKRLKKGDFLVSYKTNHPYIRVTDFGVLKPQKEQLLYLTDEVFEPIKRYTISKEDIYISIAGTIGIVGKVDSELDGANLTENAAKLIIKNPTIIARDYLMWC